MTGYPVFVAQQDVKVSLIKCLDVGSEFFIFGLLQSLYFISMAKVYRMEGKIL